jgi:hypothetical protein
MERTYSMDTAIMEFGRSISSVRTWPILLLFLEEPGPFRSLTLTETMLFVRTAQGLGQDLTYTRKSVQT